jgi:hypothetical protein
MRTFCTMTGVALALALSTSAFAQERHVVTADKLAQTVSQPTVGLSKSSESETVVEHQAEHRSGTTQPGLVAV